jgi:hypothetical protein
VVKTTGILRIKFYVLKEHWINQQIQQFTALFQSAKLFLLKYLTLCIRLISDVPLAQTKDNNTELG